MSRPQYLRQSVINQMLDGIARGQLTSPLPSQAALARLYHISRTTVRHTLDYLKQRGIVARRAGRLCIARAPTDDEGFMPLPCPAHVAQFEQALHALIRQRQLRPGDNINEQQLVQASGMAAAAVRDLLLRFSRYGLLENAGRGEWQMRTLEPAYAENLCELREMLEMHALRRFFSLPPEDGRWATVRALLARHRQLHVEMSSDYCRFAQLDRQLHALILSAADNPFFDRTLEIVAVIFQFHCQWDGQNLARRTVVAVEDHMALLLAMVNRNEREALRELRAHLGHARQTLTSALDGRARCP
ncbi:GntR family transcriptional regulator [Nissabacter sp. SGAir0207]|uniref:GntR family transcriptional regulator n=1 Tax=Nissabacter sp. SGAir0207 TaxID=2126321 RepID=UPI0010CCFE2D|nr:GntR family transcriptional regulator [Nissabacter sp. SGAir0207]QCR35892.1 GntR family transcriptional regulator [Nissabacter sp. SGAir0207]